MVKDASISLNRLALYINSKSLKQREILHQRKYPDPDLMLALIIRSQGRRFANTYPTVPTTRQ
jgi:hypothetical protein